MNPELRGLMIAADAHFPELNGHSERTASFAVAAAHHLGVAPARLVSLRIASALHYSWTHCCNPDTQVLVRGTLPDDPRAADFIRGMHATWNMASIESSILAAACRYDLRKMGVECPEVTLRSGVQEALQMIAKLITPLDFVRCKRHARLANFTGI